MDQCNLKILDSLYPGGNSSIERYQAVTKAMIHHVVQ